MDAEAALKELRKPFPANQISKLPKATKKQTEDVKNDYKLGIRCQLCGQWHHKDVVHLDYVGHAALTDRLLDVDPMWNWEPVGFDSTGQPAFDKVGGMWIRLTVAGMTRIGYGNADGKSGGDAVKEVIGDALRNAAMRFGAALDLWHKGDLHMPEAEEVTEAAKPAKQSPPKQKETPKDERQPSEREVSLWKEMNSLTSLRGLKMFWQDNSADLKYMGEAVFKRFEAKKDELKAKLPSEAKQEDDRFPGDEPIRDVSGREMHNVEA